MSTIKAIYRHGVFEPLEPVNLPEDKPVRLSIDSAEEESPQAWLARIRELQNRVFEREGYLPDSTAEIAADRLR